MRRATGKRLICGGESPSLHLAQRKLRGRWFGVVRTDNMLDIAFEHRLTDFTRRVFGEGSSKRTQTEDAEKNADDDERGDDVGT